LERKNIMSVQSLQQATSGKKRHGSYDTHESTVLRCKWYKGYDDILTITF